MGRHDAIHGVIHYIDNQILDELLPSTEDNITVSEFLQKHLIKPSKIPATQEKKNNANTK